MAAQLPARRRLTRAQRVAVFDGNGGLCHLCGKGIGRAKWDADHVLARWKKGTDAIGNYKPAHIACHAGKSGQETSQRAKADAVRAKHLGARPAPQRPIQSRGFAPTEKAVERAEAPTGRLPVPRARTDIYGRKI